MRKTIQIAVLVAAAWAFMGCSNHGVARLPSVDQIFVTTAGEDAFVAKRRFVVPYQPVGILEYKVSKCAPCGATIPGQYGSLEEAMNEQLMILAKEKLGADAVVDFQASVVSSFDLAVEAAAATPYASILLPIAYLANTNTVTMKGLAVKKK